MSFLPLLTAAEMRDWERRCFSEGDISERVVMESAGRAAALAVARHFPRGRVVAAVGGGNNGGDAIVALRTLRATGREVAAVHAGAAGEHRALAHGWEIPALEAMDEEAFRKADVVIDGLLGTGATGAPRDPIRGIIASVNAGEAPVVALDGPSGVDLSTGEVAGEAVRAAVTVTFGALKRGLLLYPGRARAGRILVAEVGFPPWENRAAAAGAITGPWARAHLPAIPADAHKGRVGLVAVAAGRQGVGGAAVMAAMGALRAGAGGVRIVSPEANRVLLQATVPEAIFLDRDDGDLEVDLDRVTGVLVGPGIGTDGAAVDLFERLLRLDVPLAIDADAITILSRRPEMLNRDRAGSVVLTPHPGELGRLLGTSTEAVIADRVAAAVEAAERFGCAVLSKGSPSLVAAPGRPVLVGTTGHSGVATGGMGDTLGGIVAALLAIGLDPHTGAAVALHYAGRAAELAGRGRGLLPRDVAEAFPYALAETAEERPEFPFLFELEAARSKKSEC
ncbi:MAG TPA: NAD(P)H-hydrate dehydratase [Candidatus Limnocylindrales bacterium]|nr:NAD(P)H-hydrate dehydratase [Candidatus Limnocylindrales bacterium]